MTAEDWPYVSKIYLEGIATEHATFQTTCPPYTAWDASHTKDCRLVGRRERIARDCHGRWLDTFLMEHRCKEDEPTGYKKL